MPETCQKSESSSDSYHTLSVSIDGAGVEGFTEEKEMLDQARRIN